MKKYDERRDFVACGLNELGWHMKRTPATMYFWLKVPKGETSMNFCKRTLEASGVVLTPGIAFGDLSDDHFRLSIVQPDEKLKEALKRLKNAGIRYE